MASHAPEQSAEAGLTCPLDRPEWWNQHRHQFPCDLPRLLSGGFPLVSLFLVLYFGVLVVLSSDRDSYQQPVEESIRLSVLMYCFL